MDGYIKTIRQKIGHDMLILVGAGVIVYRDSKILLQKRQDNKCWAIHGGCVEIGEAVEDTAKRELFEETGLIAKSLEFFGVFSGQDMLYTYPNGDKVYIIGNIYICRDFSGELHPQTDETDELIWFSINDLPKDISPPDIRPLKKFVKYVNNEMQE